MNKEIKEIWWVGEEKIETLIKSENNGINFYFVDNKEEKFGGRVGLDLTGRMRKMVKYGATHFLWEHFCGKNVLTDKMKKKYSKLIHPRGAFISRIIVSRAKDLFCERYGIDRDMLSKIIMINARIFRGRRRPLESLHEGCRILLDHKNDFTEKEYDTLLSDLFKYNVSTSKWMMYKLRDLDWQQEKIDFKIYLNLLKKIPKLVRKCKYGFVIDDEEFVKNYNPQPQNRFQYFWLLALHSYQYDYIIKEYILKLLKTDINCWHYFKNYMHLKKTPYSCRELKHLLDTIRDGIMIYNRNKDSKYNNRVIEVKGSPLRMLKNSIFNHRQDREINKLEMLEKPNYPMTLPPVNLPNWIEAIRIKDTHSLISAGMECRHCIGSYTHSNDIFVRERDICAQIDRNSLRVIQCYDVEDRITKESEKLKSKLTRALNKIKDENRQS